MNTKSGRKKAIMFPLLIVLITILLIAFGSSLFIDPATSVTQLDSGWSVSYAGNTYSEVTLSKFDFGSLKKGDLITISATLPIKQIYAPTIMFKTSDCTVDVMIDSKYVYSFGHLYDDMKKFVPKKIHLVTLDDMSTDHSIEIMFKVTENNALRAMYPIYCGNRRELIKNFLQRQRLSVFIGGFLMMYACIQISLEVYLFLTHHKNNSLFYSAFISLVFGFYTYAYKDIFCIVSDRDYFFSMVEFISLYLIPLSISLLLHSTYPSIANNLQRVFIVINVIVPAAFLALHALNIAHLNTFVNEIQIVALIENIIIIPQLVTGILSAQREREKSATYTDVDANSYLLIGFVILISFTFIEILKYNLVKLNSSFLGEYANINFLTIGSLYFIICLFIYYFFHGIDHMNAQFLQEHLEGLAYTDALTGLMNRAKCMQYLASVTGTYAIVSLDLDRLKTINDNFGHNEGDKMIKAFADLLTQSFETASIIGRTGGDEFLVAIENPSATICDESIQKLNHLMDEFNKAGNATFNLSASAGYAYSYEDQSGKFENIFYLADTRMYKIKEVHHE